MIFIGICFGGLAVCLIILCKVGAIQAERLKMLEDRLEDLEILYRKDRVQYRWVRSEARSDGEEELN